MHLKEQSPSSNLSNIKRCSLHRIFYLKICPLCEEKIGNISNGRG